MGKSSSAKTERPITSSDSTSTTNYHIPALLSPTIDGLQIRPDGIYVDATFGGGGHSCAILERLSEKGSLYAFDQDKEALQNAIDDQRWHFVHANFRYLSNFLDYFGIRHIDGLIADLGVSFHHFDEAERGFSFRFAGPLDMRMNQDGALTAADIVNTYSEEDLSRILYLYGELKNARLIARKLIRQRAINPILTTQALTLCLIGQQGEDIAPHYKKELSCVFQALRIAVNDELGALQALLPAARDALASGGRIAVLTYHSLEDRIVKNFFRTGNIQGEVQKDFYGHIICPFRITEKGRTADEEEVTRNPRARSAKLRIAEKI